MLTLCPTPIGNLGDVTARQVEALREAEIIACEDTRRTGKLLELLGIPRPEGKPELWRFDEHRGPQQVEPLLRAMKGGRRVVLVSDAGTPTIADPGYRLVRACRVEGVEVVALPGPVAGLVALSGAGLPTDRFHFEGFFPAKKGERRERLEALVGLGVTVVAYESPHRLLETLRDVQEVFGGEQELVLARELTKLHEEYLWGTVESVLEEIIDRGEDPRGEFVVCLGPSERGEEVGDDVVDLLIRALLKQELTARTIKEVVSETFDVSRSELYDRIRRIESEAG